VVSRRHLANALDHDGDRDWRNAHRGSDNSPEDTLWRAAQAVNELAGIVEGES
jgi:hypothetical protein